MRLFTLSLICILFFSFAPPDEKSTVTAGLKMVTVYRTGAEIQHTASANLKSGNNELVIEGISSYLDANSIQVNCPAAVTILGMEFSNNYLGAENISPAVKSLKDSIENINEKISQYNIMINTYSELGEVLRMNRDIKGSQTGMSVTELSKLMEYYKNKSVEVQTNLMNYREKKSKLESVVRKLNMQIAEEQSKNTKSGGRIILQLSVALPGNYDFNVSYITNNAGWTPFYDIKSDNIKSPLSFIYKARIFQTTGIDWKKVKLSLSTASPKQSGKAPVLSTWFLGYVDPVRKMNRDLAKSNSINTYGADEPRQELEEVVVSGLAVRGNRSIASSEPIYIVNGVMMSKQEQARINPNSIKSLKVLQATEATSIYGSQAAAGAVVITLKEGLQDYISVTENELDVNYDISLPYDVPTTGKPQIATLKQESIPATYKYYAVPKLSKEAYLVAEIPNWQTFNFLPGEANIIFEGTYVGKSFLDPSDTNDTLNLTLGTDKRVVIKREKMTDYSSVKFLGTNKVQEIMYEITVKNNKNEPINLILKDQYPISTNKEIEVNIMEISNGFNNEEIGVITWQMNIPSGKNEKRRIGYSVKHPKGKQVNIN